jgi:hypothetical protein
LPARRLFSQRRRCGGTPDSYVDIRDRLKDVIISLAAEYLSVEVEGVLLRHAAVQGSGSRRDARL